MTATRVGGNVLLLVIACVLTFATLEAGLRLLLDVDELLPNEPSKPALNERRNELRFYVENRDRSADSLGGHDPWLGWDSSYGESRVRGVAVIPPKSGTRAVALGDSFVYGNEVGPEENFAALLDRADNGLEVLNLGVPGYGIDQSWLKYLRHGEPLDPDIVIFGIYVADYERATVAFTAAAKPLFAERDGGWVPTGQPVPAPAESLARIARSLEGRSRLLDFFRYRLAAIPDTTASFFTHGDAIARHVLGSLAIAVLPGRRLLIVHIPRGESFTAKDPFDAAMNDHLLAIYRELSLPVVDLGAEFLARTAADEAAARYYVVRESGSVGHLNAQGHRVAAAAIGSALERRTP
ncbi:MAG: GDSL-type esterase/lipase family protein [Pseudomonadales bacterium]